jgi:hypothetical protein
MSRSVVAEMCRPGKKRRMRVTQGQPAQAQSWDEYITKRKEEARTLERVDELDFAVCVNARD